MTDDQGMTRAREWTRDALDRKPLATYLTNSLQNQAAFQSTNHHRGVTVALDADWGAGKTFFVKEWIEDLRAANYPVVYFDAWENDIGDEASVALMAAVLGGLESWRGELPATDNIRERATALKKSSIAKLRKAVIPITGIVIKGVVKKVVGIGIDEISATYTGVTDTGESSSPNGQQVENTLDKLFEEALVEHETRKDALVAFKTELTALLSLIAQHTSATLPLFVFVDELDRCRPSYAIRLLEEIKHVFGVENVVYVVSTNIEQLQNSVRALYGTEFDGRRYLHRLFDREYTLPSADNRQFAKVAIRSDSIISARTIFTGLPHTGDARTSLHDSWSLISDAFSLDFRTQRQIFELADEAATGIVAEQIHALWLFFLCTLRYKDSNVLELIVRQNLSRAQFAGALERLIVRDVPISYKRPTEDRSRRGYEDASTPLSNVLATYFDASLAASRELFHKEVNLYDYPNCLYMEVIAEFGGSLHSNAPPPSIKGYAGLVRTAGYLTS